MPQVADEAVVITPVEMAVLEVLVAAVLAHQALEMAAPEIRVVLVLWKDILEAFMDRVTTVVAVAALGEQVKAEMAALPGALARIGLMASLVQLVVAALGVALETGLLGLQTQVAVAAALETELVALEAQVWRFLLT